MTKHAITIEIDDAALAGYTDEYLAMCWHLAQHNPAEFGDAMAGDLVEHIAREIVRRWLKGVQPELWHHQGRHHAQKWLGQFATYQPGEGYRPGGGFGEENIRAFHSGRYVAKPAAEDTGESGGDQ